MGNRANYVLIESGQRQIYFSRWGAPTIPSVLLSGPEATIAYVRALTPDTQLLDADWAEGGMVLDVDQRQMRFFGGWKVDREPYLRRPLLRALRILWPLWTVEWARFGAADLALSLGWDAGQALASYEDPALYRPRMREQDVQCANELKDAGSIFSVKWSETEIFDYTLIAHQMNALSLGPRLLDILKGMPPVSLPREDDPNLPSEGVFLDIPSQSLWMSGAYDPRELVVVGQIWPGWRVDAYAEGLSWQVALSGRDPSEILVPEDQAINELIEDLMSASSTDPVGLYSALIKSAQAPLSGSQNITFGVGFFSADTPPLSKDEQRATLLGLLRNQSVDNDPAGQPE